jgi:hypothetical protein
MPRRMKTKHLIFWTLLLSTPLANAQYTAQQMCDEIPRAYRTKQIHVFFDARDRQGPWLSLRSRTEMKNFSVTKEVAGGTILINKMGELFRGFQTGIGFFTDQHQIYFQNGQDEDGRVLTKIFEFPKKVPANANKPSWMIYKLCRYEPCDDENKQRGQWQNTTRYLDNIQIAHGDVFAFYYNRNRVPQDLNCLPRVIDFDGEIELERQ